MITQQAPACRTETSWPMRDLKLAMSNIAWPPRAREPAYRQLQACGFTGLEIAPGLLFATEADPRRPSTSSIRSARLEAERYGLSLVAMQALHFGLPRAQLFGDESARDAFAGAIDACLELARQLDIGVLTIGSVAARRIPEGMDPGDASGHARETVLPLADRAHRSGLRLAMEPIPLALGANFLTTLSEAIEFVRACDHPAIRVNLDTGAMLASGELSALAENFEKSAPWLGHVHLCGLNLQPVTLNDAWIGELLRLVRRHADLSLWVSAEMRPDENDDMRSVTTASEAICFHARALPGGP